MLISEVTGVCRWRAIGKNSATGASAAAQPASQQSQTQGAPKADLSRWLSRGAMDTLKWQVCTAPSCRCAIMSCGQQACRTSCRDWPRRQLPQRGSADGLCTWVPSTASMPLLLLTHACVTRSGSAQAGEAVVRGEQWCHTRVLDRGNASQAAYL